MKKFIAIILVVVTVFSLTGCLSKEERAEAERKEKEATVQMKKYLESNYPGFRIVGSEQLISGGWLEGYNIEDVTEFTVHDKTKTAYKFYYDLEYDVVYSTVNYDKILSELEDLLEENDFIDDADSGTSQILIGNNKGFKAVLDEHDSLKDILKYIQKGNKTTYYFESKFYYKNLKNLEPEDLEIDIDIYEKLSNCDIYIYNVTKNYSKDNPQQHHIIDAIRFHDNAYEEDYYGERRIGIAHTHHKIKEIDDLVYIYDDRYADFKIEETEFYKSDDLIKYNSTYRTKHRGYDIELLIKDPTVVEYGDVVTKYRNENDILIMVHDEDVNKATVYFEASEYKDCIVYHHIDDRIDQFFAFDEYEDVNFYCHDTSLHETITLMKKVNEN